MAYDFLAESRHEVDWARIAARLRETGEFVEAFPIPPTFLLDPLALGFAGVGKFRFMPLSLAAAVLAGVTGLCGGLAIRKLARVA